MRFLALFFLTVSALAQVPAPQIPLTGTAGSGGNFPFINSGSFAMPNDADYTVLWPNTTCVVCKVTSSVSLTSTRNLIEPALGMTFNITNATTGGQSLVVKAATGSGVTIPSGASKWIWFNGTSYVEIDPTSGTFGVALLVNGQVTVSTPAACSPTSVAAGTCIVQVTNCGIGMSTSVGVLVSNTYVSGVSFNIQSLNAGNTTINTSDQSLVCWKID